MFVSVISGLYWYVFVEKSCKNMLSNYKQCYFVNIQAVF